MASETLFASLDSQVDPALFTFLANKQSACGALTKFVLDLTNAGVTLDALKSMKPNELTSLLSEVGMASAQVEQVRAGLETEEDARFAMPPPPPRSYTLANMVFETLDTDNSGELDFGEYMAIAGHVPPEYRDAFPSSFLMTDWDGSGTISRDEWLHLMLGYLNAIGDETAFEEMCFALRAYLQQLVVPPGKIDRLPKIDELFAAFDLDGNGEVELSEFLMIARSEGQAMELFQWFLFMDSLGKADGTLQLAEFRKFSLMFYKYLSDYEFSNKMQRALTAVTTRRAQVAKARAKQSAFVFIKPHANSPQVQALVKASFDKVGISVLSEGEIDGATIDTNKYIDQHYYAIASKATIKKPAELNVPEGKFRDFFGEEWATVKEEGRAFNALDLKAETGWDSQTLDEKWDATGVKNAEGQMTLRIKFGGGFYCGVIEHGGKKLYTFNAFFMTMRGKFTAPTESIHYYVVDFHPSTLSWADFRGKVLGPTNPAEAPKDSLRGILHSDWEELGLASAPNTGDNGVHASASPFEGLAERTNWLSGDYTFESDPFGKVLLDKGIPVEVLKEWSVDPQVTIEAGGKKGSMFDAVEDMDLDACVDRCVEIYNLSK